MKRTVRDPCRPGEIDRPGKLRDKREHLFDRGGGVVAHRHIERLGRDVLFGAVGGGAFDAGRDRFNDRGVKEPRVGRAGELVRKRLCLFRGDIESEHLDRDQPVARRLVRAKDGTERSHADLMQHPKGAERRRWGERRRVVSRQFWSSSRRVRKNLTHYLSSLGSPL